MFNKEEEQYILDSIKQIKAETHENNIMLKSIIKYINTILAHHNKENDNDFERNVLANLLSGMLDINQLFKRR